MSSDNWFIRLGTRNIGPITIHQLREMVQSGQLRPEDQVRSGSSKQWLPLSELAVLSNPPTVSTARVPVGVSVAPAIGTKRKYVRTTDGKTFGPVSAPEVDAWVKERRITAECQILEEGTSQWRLAAELYPELHQGIPSHDDLIAINFPMETSASRNYTDTRKGVAARRRSKRNTNQSLWVVVGVAGVFILAGLLAFGLSLSSTPSPPQQVNSVSQSNQVADTASRHDQLPSDKRTTNSQSQMERRFVGSWRCQVALNNSNIKATLVLRLNVDRTFSTRGWLDGDEMPGKSGTWRIENNTLVLNFATDTSERPIVSAEYSRIVLLETYGNVPRHMQYERVYELIDNR